MNNAVIIVAAGTGSRMLTDIPKQFLELNGLPVVMHTINRFHEYDPAIKIILVIAEEEQQRWERLTEHFNFTTNVVCVTGGSTRFESVANGLNAVKEEIVAIHDAVRPLVSLDLIRRSYEEAEKHTVAVPAIPIADTIREMIDKSSRVIDRKNLRIIQTPQCFNTILLKKAYSNATHKTFTDDAGVFESDGNEIYLIPGEKSNIKITLPEDLSIASVLHQNQSLLRK
jgi:2-C-methyl-D-erythritol 4-phosphate cytidylyltransferase